MLGAVMLMLVVLYVGVGLVAGLAFVLRGVDRVDAVALSSGLVFRVVILPGCIGLWPVVVWMWIKACRRGEGGEA